MQTRLNDVPALRIGPAIVEASLYNRIRLGLRRLGRPLRLELPNLRGLDALFDDDLWVCVDRTLDDLPVLAWTDFPSSAQRGLHEPVACRVRHYHFYSGIIMKSVLEEVEKILAARLAASRPPMKQGVVRLPAAR